MKRISTYKATFDLINSLENSYFQKESKFISECTVFFSKEFIILFREKTKRISPHIYKNIRNLLDWLWKKNLRPFFLLIQGVIIIFKNGYISYITLNIISLCITYPLLLQDNTLIQVIGFKIFIYVFFISFLIISFLSFDYHYSKRDFKRINKFVVRIQLFNSEEIKAIQSNLQLIRKKHSKQVNFLNSTVSFLWGFAIAAFMTAYKKGDYIIALEILENNFSKLLSFLGIFILNRGYSKIYSEIFNIAEYACNEATTLCKKQ